ncbi:Enoyl-CoA hydratase [Ceraceosorus bombacis]|uniref:3-hydroxyisobutyryl-CoA hydrolase n=1 Tax=Ceraceosorus bombacis TaxID=401625 RepID=A0A0P1BKZ3_9BASI|nr:Enoyl-CoA hydratase [Ceraceosorus bombacis]
MSRRLSQISSHLSGNPRGPPAMQAFGAPGGRGRSASSSSHPSSAGAAVAKQAATASRTGGGESGKEPKVQQLSEGPLRTIVLNRPKALNALDLDMVTLIGEALHNLSKTDAPIILLRGVGRGLCSGGDVKSVVEAAASQDPNVRAQALTFFKAEFEVDFAIATLQKRTNKTFVSVMDGITMGGGVGLSVHAPIRIATESTRFAMPETGIGYWPDVGVTRVLSRLDGRVGYYLGTTGTQISGEEAYLAGLATHFIPKRLLSEALDRLRTLPINATTEQVARALTEYTVDPFAASDNEKGPQIFADTPLVGARRVALDHVFGLEKAEQIFAALEELSSGSDDTQTAKQLIGLGVTSVSGAVAQWAQKTLETLQSKSPRSIKVSLKAITAARRLDIAEAFRFDMRLATAFCDLSAGRDFYTGVTHVLTKDPNTGKRREGRAAWDPSDLESVKDEHVNDLFFGNEEQARKAGLKIDVPFLSGLPQPKTFPSEKDRAAYEAKIRGVGPLAWEPAHNQYALPSEAEVAALIQGAHPAAGATQLEPSEIITILESKTGDRRGVERKVSEFFERVQARAAAAQQ